MGGKSSKKKGKRPGLLSVLTIGNSMAGKTALIQRYANNFFEQEALTTIANDFVLVNKVFKCKDEEVKVKVKIWDSPGQERFESIVVSALKNTQGILLVYDTTERKSFNDLQTWINRINSCNKAESFPFILIANKIDLKEKRAVTENECKAFADNLKIPYFETSAKTGQGVTEAFNSLFEKVFSTQLNDDSEHFTIKQ